MATYMMKCKECQEDLGKNYTAFSTLSKYISESQALDDVGLKKECCRKAMVGLSAVAFGDNTPASRAVSSSAKSRDKRNEKLEGQREQTRVTPNENSQQEILEKPQSKDAPPSAQSIDEHTVKSNQSKRSRGSFVAKIKSAVKPKKTQKEPEATATISGDERSRASSTGSDRAGAEVMSLIDSIYKHLNDRGVNGRKRKDKVTIDEAKKERAPQSKEKKASHEEPRALSKAMESAASIDSSIKRKSNASTKKETSNEKSARKTTKQVVPDKPSTTNTSRISTQKKSFSVKPAIGDNKELAAVASSKNGVALTATKNGNDQGHLSSASMALSSKESRASSIRKESSNRKPACEEKQQSAPASMGLSTKKIRASSQTKPISEEKQAGSASRASSAKKSQKSTYKETIPSEPIIDEKQAAPPMSTASSAKKSKASTQQESASAKLGSKTSASKKRFTATPEETFALYESLFEDIAKVDAEVDHSEKPIPTEVCFAPKTLEAEAGKPTENEVACSTSPAPLPSPKSSAVGSVKSAPEKAQPKSSLGNMIRSLSYRSVSSTSGKGIKLEPLEPLAVQEGESTVVAEQKPFVITTEDVGDEIELHAWSYKASYSISEAKEANPEKAMEDTQKETQAAEATTPHTLSEEEVPASEHEFLALVDGPKPETKGGRDPVELARSMESYTSKNWIITNGPSAAESIPSLTEKSKVSKASKETIADDAPKTDSVAGGTAASGQYRVIETPANRAKAVEVFLPPVKGGKPPKAPKKGKEAKQDGAEQEVRNEEVTAEIKSNEIKQEKSNDNQPVDDETASCSTESDSVDPVAKDSQLAEKAFNNCSPCGVTFSITSYLRKIGTS